MDEPLSASAWDAEYEREGIPSSARDEPSAAVVWTLQAWPLLAGASRPATALDVGCGTARNAVYLANQGVRVRAFDLSRAAIATAETRAGQAGVDLELSVHDLSQGLPATNHEIDLITDLFVYKHQTDPETRRRYRAEAARALTSAGRFLVSLAEPDDGYYGACPDLSNVENDVRAVLDPMLGLGSVLFSLEQLAAEMADRFSLEMAWRKQSYSTMYGRQYARRTLATTWRPLT